MTESTTRGASRLAALAMGLTVNVWLLGFRPIEEPRQTGDWLRFWAGKDIARLQRSERGRFEDYVREGLLNAADQAEIRMDHDSMFVDQGKAYVWRFRPDVGNRFLVYVAPTPDHVPSAAHAWLFIVTDQGTLLNRADFYTGWRMYPAGASYEKVEWAKDPVLIQKMEFGIDPRRIFIGFNGIRPETIRLDDGAGNLQSMDYQARNEYVGPRFDLTSKAEVARALTGPGDVRRLEAMVWLAGRHQDVSERGSEDDRDLISDALLYAQCIDDPTIRRTIKSLTTSRRSYTAQLAKTIPAPRSPMQAERKPWMAGMRPYAKGVDGRG